MGQLARQLQELLTGEPEPEQEDEEPTSDAVDRSQGMGWADPPTTPQEALKEAFDRILGR